MTLWDKPTAVLDRFGLSEDRIILIDKICHKFNIPARGVVFVFEKDDYQNYPNPTWGNKAVYINVAVDGVEEMSPQHLVDLMVSQDYSQIIWFSKQACASQDIIFVWTFSHEIQHLEQNLRNTALSKAGHFLVRTLGLIEIEEPKVQNAIPTELDANLKAWNVTQKLLGKETADTFVKDESISGKHKQSFQILISHKLNNTYDVFGCTINILRKYSAQFKDLQAGSNDGFVRNFNIEEICLELSHPPRFQECSKSKTCG